MTYLKKPMLADNKPWDPAAVEANLPLAGFIKLDGIRCLVDQGVGYSRSLKPLPNKQLQAKIAANAIELQGFDGEIIVGEFTDEFCFKESHRACMKEDLEADHRFIAFDLWNKPDYSFELRHQILTDCAEAHPVPMLEVLPYKLIETMEELDRLKDWALDNGHEGTIWRRLDAFYKNGRATTKSGGMYKNKSRVDTEVTIIEWHEQMENLNEKTTNELGRSQRSSHQENKVGKDTLGAFTCTGFFEDGTPFTTKVGVFSGFTDADKQNIWNKRHQLTGKMMKIKYMGIGSDQAPRTPVALGFRDAIDMS